MYRFVNKLKKFIWAQFVITCGFAIENLFKNFDWEIPSHVTFTILNISFVYIQRVF